MTKCFTTLGVERYNLEKFIEHSLKTSLKIFSLDKKKGQ